MNREGYWKEYQRPPEYFVKAAEAQRKRRAANPEKYRAITRVLERRRKLRKYGLTEETYTALLNNQKGVCAICKSPNFNGRNWHLDHDHATGKLRGILCHHCNLMLGNAKDTIETLENAIKYLQVHSCPST